ncbi:hypothetical protein [Mastigocladopsis repens]|uniref:hypothetical protein n=1 Tax=Mastigocladopsis repens TaxID=221287 RepID=UPI00030FB1DD|nr:hypothetical protein [Mastigocladopsis repens]
MKVNPFTGISQVQKRKLGQQRLYLRIRKFQNLLRTPSVKVGSALSGASIILIISPLLSKQGIDWFNVWQNMGFNLLGAVCAFVAFDIVFRRLKELDEQQGVELDLFDKSDFITTIMETKSFTKCSPHPIASIRILETWTELLRDNSYKEKFTQAIVKYIENNNHEIEILFLNPENRDLVEARSIELQGLSEEFNDINIAEKIYINLREIQKIIQKLEVNGNQDKLKVRLYNTSPSLAIYMCAPNLFVTFFRSGKLTTMSKQLKLHIDSPVGAFINERFEEIWQDAKTISLENCLYVTVDVIQYGRVQRTYDKVKYVLCDQGYYLQNAKLFQDIANKADINIRINGRVFRQNDVAMDDLPDNVKKLFRSKYMSYGELFIFIELLK